MRTTPGMFVLSDQYSTAIVPVLVLSTCSNTVDVLIVIRTKTKVAPTRTPASSMPRVLLLHELHSEENVANLLLLLVVSPPRIFSYLLFCFCIGCLREPAAVAAVLSDWSHALVCRSLFDLFRTGPTCLGSNHLGLLRDTIISYIPSYGLPSGTENGDYLNLYSSYVNWPYLLRCHL